MPCMLGLGDSIVGVDLGIFPRVFCLSHKWRKQGGSLIAAQTRDMFVLISPWLHVDITLAGSLIISYIFHIRARDVT